MLKFLKSKRNIILFGLTLALLFSLPVYAIGRTVLQVASNNTQLPPATSQPVASTATNQHQLAAGGSDWSMYLHDLQRTSASKETLLSPANAAHLTKLWSFQTGDIVAASAAVVNGIVYVGSWDGYEYALDEITGALKWKTFLGRTIARPVCNPPELGITSSATVQDNVVYVGGGDAYWYALNAKTGAVLWKVFTGDNSADGGHYNWSSPLLYNGYAYIGIASEGDCPLVPGQLLKVSLAEHKIVTTLNLVVPGEVGGGIWTSPSVDPATNTLFISSGTATTPQEKLAQAVFSVDADTLAVKSWWTLPANEAIGDSDFDTTPILFNDVHGTPLVASINKNGKMYVFQRDNIAAGPVWTQLVAMPGMCPRCEDSSVSSNAFGQGTLYTASGNFEVNGNYYRGTVSALDPATGKFLWQRPEAGAVLGSLVYTNGLILAAAGPALEVLDATTGQRLYSYQTEQVVYATPIIAHGQIFMGSTDGKIYAFGLTATQPAAVVPDTKCPHTWSCQDIGNPVVVGSEDIAGETQKVQAGGTGISETSDQFHFISQQMMGNAQVTVKVSTPNSVGVGGISQQGLMLRQNTLPGSPYYAVLFTAQTGVVVQYRSHFDGQTIKNIPLRLNKMPLYLRIERIGDHFHAFTSQDGINYTLVPGGDVIMVMPDSVNAGLAVSSGETQTMDTVVFNSWNIQMSALASPVSSFSTPCTTGWICSDVGNPAIAGGQDFNGNTWTLHGSGTDIWSNQDQFHYVWQHLSGDGSLSVRITSHQASASFAKAGIMIREDLTPDSPYYAIFLQTGAGPNASGIAVQCRNLHGLISSEIAGIQGSAPDNVYLKITRSKQGTMFTAYYSFDGTNWKVIPGSPYPFTMDNLVMSGMVITSHDPNALSTATFDHVELN